MAAQTTIKPAVNRTEPQYTTGFVTSKDGVTIGYRQLGQGPALVMLHGANESAQSHMQLAEALAPYYTIFLPDRRGRGMSGPHGADYGSQKEVEDMAALLTKTGARYVFGVSSGAIVWLQALLSLPAIQKAALYEPPLIVNNWSVAGQSQSVYGRVAAGVVAPVSANVALMANVSQTFGRDGGNDFYGNGGLKISF